MTHVYLDRKPSGEPFYVGIGDDARIKCKARNKFHTGVCRKHAGWSRTVIETTTWDKCVELEMFLISEIGRRDLKTGTLVNLTSGGEGALGVVCSAETRLKKSKALKGVPKSDDHKIKIGAGNSGKVRSPEQIEIMRHVATGVIKSSETKDKISANSLKMWAKDGYKESHSDRMVSLWGNADYRNKLSEAHITRYEKDPVAKEKFAQVGRDTWADPERKAKQAAKVSNTLWVYKDEVSKRIAKPEIETFLNSGWEFGRKPK